MKTGFPKNGSRLSTKMVIQQAKLLWSVCHDGRACYCILLFIFTFFNSGVNFFYRKGNDQRYSAREMGYISGWPCQSGRNDR